MQGRLQNTMANIGMVFLHSLVQMVHTSKNVLQVAVGQEEVLQCNVSSQIVHHCLTEINLTT